MRDIIFNCNEILMKLEAHTVHPLLILKNKNNNSGLLERLKVIIKSISSLELFFLTVYAYLTCVVKVYKSGNYDDNMV